MPRNAEPIDLAPPVEKAFLVAVDTGDDAGWSAEESLAELANLAAFLVSDGAAYINGDAIVIDGGKMLQSGGGGANTQAMIDWTDEQWEAIRPKRK